MTKISQARREKAATVHSGGKAKFPVDSVQTAESATKLINSAKPPLSSGQRAHVMQEVHHYLPGAHAPAPKGTGSKKRTPKK